MLILNCISKETIWGGSKLHLYSGDRNVNNIGQLYTVIAQENNSNEIINGKYKGSTLYDLYKRNRHIFCYDKYTEFPFIIGFVDAKENLSLQIHPTDEYAKEYEDKPFGKNESWVFIDAPEDGCIYNGCKLENIEEVKNKMKEKKWDEIIDTLAVKKGDYVYVESGTFHAITKGSLVYEIQQSTDLTYRFYDYDRVDSNGNSRDLHIEKALTVLDPSKKSKSTKILEKTKFNEKYYSINIVEIRNKYKNEMDSFQCVTIIEGSIEIDNILVQKGMSIIVLKGEVLKFNGEALTIIAEAI